MVFPEIPVEKIMDIVIGIILHHIYFLENNLAFLLYFFCVKKGIKEDVRKNIDGLGQEFIKDLRIITDVFTAGKSVENPSQGVYLPGNIQCTAAVCTLKEEVFYEVGDAAGLPPFMAGAVGDPYSD